MAPKISLLLKARQGKREIRDMNRQGDGVTVHFTDGSTATGSLIVGADGGQSTVRDQYIGKEYKLLDPEGICPYGKVPNTRELLKWMTLCRDVAPLIRQIIWSSELPITMFVQKMHFEHRDQVRADALTCHQCPRTAGTGRCFDLNTSWATRNPLCLQQCSDPHSSLGSK
ncbi:Protein phosphatase 2c [Penicillium sp. IBT 35674x]|nr:Protein phosphatase 2c [Penicillium sp. IBT 35674x]